MSASASLRPACFVELHSSVVPHIESNAKDVVEAPIDDNDTGMGSPVALRPADLQKLDSLAHRYTVRSAESTPRIFDDARE